MAHTKNDHGTKMQLDGRMRMSEQMQRDYNVDTPITGRGKESRYSLSIQVRRSKTRVPDTAWMSYAEMFH